MEALVSVVNMSVKRMFAAPMSAANANQTSAANANQPGSTDGTAGSGQRGFTLLEIVVALTVLSAGSSVLWYGLRSSAKMDRLNRLHHAAVTAARSDLESLRSRPKQEIHDTAYLAFGAGGDSLLVVRRVMDSARIVNSLEEITLDDKLSPKELHKPLEVRVSVFLAPAEDAAGFLDQADSPSDGFGSADDEWDSGEGAGRPLAALILKLPEYRWY
jgi:prepilin-type N-terminal cleavage/methylation domain-containing protein